MKDILELIGLAVILILLVLSIPVITIGISHLIIHIFNLNSMYYITSIVASITSWITMMAMELISYVWKKRRDV